MPWRPSSAAQQRYAGPGKRSAARRFDLSARARAFFPSRATSLTTDAARSQVGVRGKDIVVLGVEKRSVAKLQDPRTVRKICALDSHVAVAFAGLTADGRVLIDKVRVKCQSYRSTVEDAPSIDYVTKYVAGVQQKYTQQGGVRPFGVSTLIAGFDQDGVPKLYQTDPSGTYAAWKAAATGRSAKSVQEFLEKHYKVDAAPEGNAAIKLAMSSLMEVVEAGSRNLEIAVLAKDQPIRFLKDEEIETFIKEIEAEAEAAANA